MSLAKDNKPHAVKAPLEIHVAGTPNINCVCARERPNGYDMPDCFGPAAIL